MYKYGYKLSKSQGGNQGYLHLYIEVCAAPSREHGEWNRLFTIAWQSDPENFDREDPWYGAHLKLADVQSPDDLMIIAKTAKKLIKPVDRNFSFNVPPRAVVQGFENRRDMTRIVYDSRVGRDIPFDDVRPEQFCFFSDPGGWVAEWAVDEIDAQLLLTRKWAALVSDGNEPASRFSKWIEAGKPVEIYRKNGYRPQIETVDEWSATTY